MGRWLAGVYGNTQGSDVALCDMGGVYSISDFYYIRQEGGLEPPPNGGDSASKVTTAADLEYHGRTNGTYYVDIHGSAFQMTYDSSVKFDTGVTAGVSGWLKIDNAWVGANISNLSSSTYSTGNPLDAGWGNQGNGEFFTGDSGSSNTGATGIGHVRWKIPKFQYACFQTMTCNGSGSQTPDDDTSWWGNTGYRANVRTYAVDRVPVQSNPGGYVVALYEEGASGIDSDTASTQGIVLPKPGGEFGNLSGSATRTFASNQFAPVGFDNIPTNNCWWAAYSGDSGHERIDYNSYELWIH